MAGSKLFDAILDGMEAEELEYLEYERSLMEERKEETIVSPAAETAATAALETRLQALRLVKKSSDRPKVQAAGAVEKEESTPTSIASRLDYLFGSSQKARHVVAVSWIHVGALQFTKSVLLFAGTKQCCAVPFCWEGIVDDC